MALVEYSGHWIDEAILPLLDKWVIHNGEVYKTSLWTRANFPLIALGKPDLEHLILKQPTKVAELPIYNNRVSAKYYCDMALDQSKLNKASGGQ